MSTVASTCANARRITVASHALNAYSPWSCSESHWDLGVVDVSRSEFNEFTPEMYSY
jgi:hypothetical protein